MMTMTRSSSPMIVVTSSFWKLVSRFVEEDQGLQNLGVYYSMIVSLVVRQGQRSVAFSFSAKKLDLYVWTTINLVPTTSMSDSRKDLNWFSAVGKTSKHRNLL